MASEAKMELALYSYADLTLLFEEQLQGEQIPLMKPVGKTHREFWGI